MLEVTFLELEKAMSSFEAGPYILSDYQYKNTNIFFRYGGFKKIINSEGKYCIKNTYGELIEDIRKPYPITPEFINTPQFLKEFTVSIGDINNNKLERFEVTEALRHNNGSSIYKAFDKVKGQNVILKEAYPNNGLDANLMDAQERLMREKQFLEKNSSNSYVPKLVDYFDVWICKYLVQEFIEGETLQKWLATNYPFVCRGKNEYCTTALRIAEDLVHAVNSLHESGLGLGDIQPANIMIKDEKLKLIDFETSNKLYEVSAQSMGTKGFTDETLDTIMERDWFGVKKTILYMFMPIGPVQDIDTDILYKHLRWIEDYFGRYTRSKLEEIIQYCDTKVPTLKRYEKNSSKYQQFNLDVVHSNLGKGLMYDIKISKQSLIYGDVRQFEKEENKYNVLTGGFGALLALSDLNEKSLHCEEGDEIKHICTKWRLSVSREILNSHKKISYGLLDGLAGIASVNYKIRAEREAHRLFSKLIKEKDQWDWNDISLRSGISGIGLALMKYNSVAENNCCETLCIDIANRINECFLKNMPAMPEDWEAVGVGLIDGWTGAALYLIELYRITGDYNHITMARKILEKESFHLKKTELYYMSQVCFDNKLLPYLMQGSLGIGLVMKEYEKVSNENHFKEVIKDIQKVNDLEIFYTAGLFVGAAGFLLAPLMEDDLDKSKEEFDKAFKRMSNYLIEKEGALYCPGNFSLKLSSDYYSGSSGLMLAIKAFEKRNFLHIFPLI